MGDERDIAAATESWRARAESLISFAELTAPAPEDDFSLFSAARIEDPEAELEARVSALLEESDNAVPDDAGASGLPLLLGDLEVASVLLTASQEPDLMDAAMGLEGGAVRFDEARVRLAILTDAANGVVETPARQLPESVGGKFDELQNAGGSEIVELAKSPTVQAAAIGGVKALVVVTGPQVAQSFEAVKRAVSWIRRQAVRIIQWVIEKLRSLVPEAFRERFDDLVEKTKEKLVDGIPGLVGDVLGALLGRPAATDAWRSITDERSAELEPRLDDTVKGQLTRIGYITTARTTVDRFSIVAESISAVDVVPHVRIAVFAVVGGVLGFVGYQVFDGFRRLEELARS